LLGYGNDPAILTKIDCFLKKITEKEFFWSQGAYGIDILGELGISFASKTFGVNPLEFFLRYKFEPTKLSKKECQDYVFKMVKWGASPFERDF
jgi:hypothetical protein